ncbi:Hypothetical predicted protein [Drosophila guanche]|uniref:Uncharacterized protein n=1 Tax=Drosophila guanche TaxID=7266 RepID=A0A3B0JHT4_DROGU|nr:Hypothetical predicted protein [Drosophila guanche]
MRGMLPIVGRSLAASEMGQADAQMLLGSAGKLVFSRLPAACSRDAPEDEAEAEDEVAPSQMRFDWFRRDMNQMPKRSLCQPAIHSESESESESELAKYSEHWP